MQHINLALHHININLQAMKLKTSLLLSIIFILCNGMSCDDGDESDHGNLLGFQLVNLNNEGEAPFFSRGPIKKEAYAIGIIYFIDRERKYDHLSFENVEYGATGKIYCNTDFNHEYLAGSDISDIFIHSEKTDSAGVDALFLLKEIPQAGNHSFKIVYTLKDGTIIESSTEPIELY
ncbi:MAG: hypothetical protein E6767_03345 [Dysgonomonas sp.]|nr:hypothetical protein [Dysgonomonas sp.]